MGRPPGEGNGNPLQYSCLENPTGGGAWWATVHGATKSQRRLSDFTSTLLINGLPRWLSGKGSAHQAGDVGLIPGSGRSPGEGDGYLLRYSCLENPMDRGAWWATVSGVAKSWKQLEQLSMHTCTICIGGVSGEKPACQCGRHKRCRFDPWVRKIPWRRAWQLTPVSLPGESHGQRSLVGYSPRGCKELDMTE